MFLFLFVAPKHNAIQKFFSHLFILPLVEIFVLQVALESSRSGSLPIIDHVFYHMFSLV